MDKEFEFEVSNKKIKIPPTHYAALLLGSMVVLGTSMVGPMKIYQGILSYVFPAEVDNVIPQPGPEAIVESGDRLTTDQLAKQMDELLTNNQEGTVK